jgi:hypothetical protein
MLFTGVEARRVQHDKLTHDDTVVAAAHDFPASFEQILRVLPRTAENGAEKAWERHSRFFQPFPRAAQRRLSSPLLAARRWIPFSVFGLLRRRHSGRWFPSRTQPADLSALAPRQYPLDELSFSTSAKAPHTAQNFHLSHQQRQYPRPQLGYRL